MRRKELDCLFGNTEIECLVEWMLNLAEKCGKDFGWTVVSHRDFTEERNFEGDMCLGGLCLALMRGLLKCKPGYNHYYVPTQKMIETMRGRECWKDMPDVPTPDDWTKEIFSCHAG